MADNRGKTELEPGEVVSATYYPSKRRLVVAGLSGALLGLILGLGYAFLAGARDRDLLIAVAGPVVGAVMALLHSVSNARLRFGTDWVEGPTYGGSGTVLMRRGGVARLEVIDSTRLLLIRGDSAGMLVNLDHYEFMDQQMIRMRLTSIAGGTTSTPPETLVVDSRRKRRGSRRDKRKRAVPDLSQGD